MAIYKVKLSSGGAAARLTNDVNTVVVSAPDAQSAREAAASSRSSDQERKAWVGGYTAGGDFLASANTAGADTTALVEGLQADFGITVTISPTTGDPETFTVGDGYATFDLLLVALEPVLEASTLVGANVTQAGRVSTIGLAAGLGAATITANLTLDGQPITSGLLAVVNAAGAAGIDRTITITDPAGIDLPKVHAEGKE